MFLVAVRSNSIIITPTEIHGREGEDIALRCTSALDKVLWFITKATTHHSNSGQPLPPNVLYNKDKNQHVIVIYNAQKYNEGKYNCREPLHPGLFKAARYASATVFIGQ